MKGGASGAAAKGKKDADEDAGKEAGSRFNAAYAFFEPGFNFPLLPNNELVGVFKLDEQEEDKDADKDAEKKKKAMRKAARSKERLAELAAAKSKVTPEARINDKYLAHFAETARLLAANGSTESSRQDMVSQFRNAYVEALPQCQLMRRELMLVSYPDSNDQLASIECTLDEIDGG